MLEAVLAQAETLKKVLDAVKELVTDANFDCSDEGIKLQAMDNSHVALVSLQLNSTGFQEFRCDRNMSLGMSLTSLQKIVKSAANDDQVTLRADESHDVLALLFENKNDRIGEYEMKLMDIDQEHLGIPDTVYDAEITLPATEFARIIRDLKELGESVKIEVTKDGVRFSADGDIGTASVTLKPSSDKSARDDDTDEEEEDDDDEKPDEDEEDETKDDDIIIDDEKVVKVADDGEDEKPEITEEGGEETKPDPEDDDDEDEQVKPPKKKKAAAVAPKKRKAPASPAKSKSKKAKADSKEAPKRVSINLQQQVTLTFSIKYLSNFAKSTPLSDYVHLHMSNEVPLLVEYPFAEGHIRYYLAPKISDE